MPLDFTRRAALGLAGGGAAFAAFAGRAGAAADATGNIRVGICTYSLREFSRHLAIQMIGRLGVTAVSVKDVHLPYTLDAAGLAKAKAEFTKAGITLVSCGNTDLKDEDPAALRRYFDYAKALEIPMIVAAPTHATMPAVEKLAKEYDIVVAIHTHGPEDPNFPSPKVVLEAVKGMDRRMGLCMDVGHSMRTGADVVQEIVNAGPRLLDLHFKDLKVRTDRDSQCDVGEGVMPVVAIIKMLQKVSYRGSVNLEYEINSDNPVPGMLHSLGYMNGVLAGLAG
jgi:sugar phosphate isomerase/epimerase